MTDACKICLTEAVCLDEWFLKTELAHGKTAVIECVCPWCVKEMIDLKIGQQLESHECAGVLCIHPDHDDKTKTGGRHDSS